MLYFLQHLEAIAYEGRAMLKTLALLERPYLHETPPARIYSGGGVKRTCPDFAGPQTTHRSNHVHKLVKKSPKNNV